MHTPLVKQETSMKTTPFPTLHVCFFWSLLPLHLVEKAFPPHGRSKVFDLAKNRGKNLEFIGNLWKFMEVYGEFIGMYTWYTVSMRYLWGNLWKFMLNLYMESFKGIVTNTNCELMEVKRQTKHYQATQKNIGRIYFAQDVWERVKHIPPPKTDDLLLYNQTTHLIKCKIRRFVFWGN